MVYQSIVLGPFLWNIFFRDVCTIIRGMRFLGIVYADDLIAFQSYPNYMRDNYLLTNLRLVRKQLHLWGESNGVRFDAAKESFHILSRSDPSGGN